MATAFAHHTKAEKTRKMPRLGGEEEEEKAIRWETISTVFARAKDKQMRRAAEEKKPNRIHWKTSTTFDFQLTKQRPIACCHNELE